MRYEPLLKQFVIPTIPTDPQELEAYNTQQDTRRVHQISALILNADDSTLVKPQDRESKLNQASSWLDAKIAEWKLKRSESVDSDIVDTLLKKLKK